MLSNIDITSAPRNNAITANATASLFCVPALRRSNGASGIVAFIFVIRNVIAGLTPANRRTAARKADNSLATPSSCTSGTAPWKAKM